MDNEMDAILKEFLIESRESLDQLDLDLVELEKNPKSQDILASIFRTAHSIKGASGFLAFPKLESVAHVGENLLSLLRDGKLEMHEGITNSLLGMGDAIRQMLNNIEEDGKEGDGDYKDLIERINLLAELTDDVEKPKNPTSPDAAGSSSLSSPEESEVIPPVNEAVSNVVETGVQVDSPSEAMTGDSSVDPEVAPASTDVTPEFPPTSDLTGGGNPAPEFVPKQTAEANIRVDVELLDRLMALVGELVLTRNQIMQYTGKQDDSTFTATCQRLNLIATELQEGVMKTRMQPIGNVWNKFPRVVRDLAKQCGKNVELKMEGKDTELDKSLIEAIKDPLTHIVRNSVDHGIETPEERTKNNKSPDGTLSLRAFHEGGKVNIEISDDGSGIDVDRVAGKAVRLGLISQEQVSGMNTRERLNLMFMPGVSTQEQVTNLSGRGVGMDVVKTNIEKIGGSIDILTNPGEGTTLKIKIPLTLAIIPALVVSSGGERFAIPQVNLLELVRLDDIVKIENVHGTPVYRLRGKLLPIVFLNPELGLACRKYDEVNDAADSSRSVNIVVLQADDRQFGLVVDEINDTEEIVVKPLNKALKEISHYAGATIMGDGKVALILDVVGLAHNADVLREGGERATLDTDSGQDHASDTRQAMLIVEVAESERMAIPLSEVARLEEIPRNTLERSGNHQVVQYRDEILPLIDLSEVFSGGRQADPGADSKQQVVVYIKQGKSIGLMVERIHDIVEENISVERRTSRPGLLGSAVLEKRVTDLIDIPEVIRTVEPNFYQNAENN